MSKTPMVQLIEMQILGIPWWLGEGAWAVEGAKEGSSTFVLENFDDPKDKLIKIDLAAGKSSTT